MPGSLHVFKVTFEGIGGVFAILAKHGVLIRSTVTARDEFTGNKNKFCVVGSSQSGGMPGACCVETL